MATSRRKADRQEAPQTIEQAVALIAEYRDLIDKIDELAAEADRAMALIAAERDSFSAPLSQRVNDIFRQLRAWWAVAAPALTDGKRKSVELAGCILGERTTPPALQLPRGKKVDEIANGLLDALDGDYLVTVRKLDKPAIVKLLRLNIDETQDDADPVILRKIRVLRDDLGLKVNQREEFFIDRPNKAPEVEVVPEVEQAA